MAYVSPEERQPESQPTADFIQKDFAAAQTPKPYVSPEETGLGDVVKQAAKAALFPLVAPAQPLIDTLGQPSEPEPFVDPETFNPDPSKGPAFPNMASYPSESYTSLAPTIDAFSAPFLAKDIATLGVKGVKGAVNLVKGNTAAKKAFLQASDDIAREAPQVELPLTGGSHSVNRPAPIMEDTMTGATSRDVNAPALPSLEQLKTQLTGPAKPKIEAFPKGKMGGGISPNTGKPLPETTIWGVRGDPEEIAKLGFGPDPASIPEHILKQKGIPIAGQAPAKAPLAFGDVPPVSMVDDEAAQTAKMIAPDSPVQPPLSQPRPFNEDAISFTPKDITDINKKTNMSLPTEIPNPRVGLGKTKRGTPTKPFEVPEPDILPTGAKARIAKLVGDNGTDLSKTHSTSTSAEMVTDVGSADKTVRDQLQAGLRGEAEAERKANTVFTDIKRKYKIDPETLDSQVLSKYMRNPNKMAAAEDLKMRLGEKEASRFINAERDLRVHFDRWRNEVNAVRRANKMPEIPYKEDYLPQIHEFNTLNLLGTPELVGTEQGAAIMNQIRTDAEVVKNNKFMHLDEITFRHLLRQGLPDVDDAIKGLEMYGREAERFKVLQPHINELRQTATEIQPTMPNLAKAYIERADHIAGKSEGIDDWLKAKIGKEAFHFYVEASNRMKKNVIQGNPNIPFSQLLVMPSIASSVPMVDSVAASVKLATQPEFRRFLIANSPTLQLRLEGATAQAMHSGVISKWLSKPSELVDQTTLLYSLGAKYIEGLKKGLTSTEAMAEAEQFASLTQATLSKLSTAPILRSQTVQSGAPFLNQVLSQTKYITKNMMRNKPLTEKAATGAKYLATALAVAAVNTMFLGEKAKTGFESSQIIPFGSAAEQGLGGPVVQSVGRFAKAKGIEGKLLQAFRSAMLYQTKIPAGLQAAKLVESMFKEGE